MRDLHLYLDKVLADARIPELPNYYRGKVRDNYDLPDGRRIIIATDRLSAFDVALAAIPFKGQVLTQTARYWFEQTKNICPNHVIAYPDPNVLIAQRVKILPVEVVVRAYLTGSTATAILPRYKAGERVLYGNRLPDGLRDNEKLPLPIITPTTKADQGEHDEPLTAQDILSRNLLTDKQWQEVSHYALALFAKGQELAQDKGLILVDTKYEFGITPEGHILLADEIHTPDSSRYWLSASYDQLFSEGKKPESFDKDFIRNWVISRCDPYKEAPPPIPADMVARTAEVYINAFEMITGASFALPAPDTHPLARIRENLKGYFQTT